MTTSVSEAPGGGFIISGEKTWITNSPGSSPSFSLLPGPTETQLRTSLSCGQRANGTARSAASFWKRCEITVAHFHRSCIWQGMKGLSAPQIKNKMGLRASVTGSIVMDDVHISKDQMLEGVTGLKGPFGCLKCVFHS